MNLDKKLFPLLILISITLRLSAQETCKVLVPELSGKYEGDCKKGKASGNGKAEGVDLYDGEFKEGLPDGKGVYQWKNGNTYNGFWLKGKKQGSGSMTYKRAGKKDSIVTGFWQKDVYAGLYEKPFIIYSRSSQIAKISINKNNKDNTNNIIIEVQNTTAGTASVSSGVQSKPQITDILLRRGNFLQINQGLAGPKSTVQQLNKVDFPFRAVFRFGSQEADIEILEPGNWKIFVNLNN
ncbi:MORN repeat-containing protein [Daejeonella oryzae]|uniref:hypothetical protein n=1 Tax=Daejeonella oryzae TaxID=1122943 RepID=UPI000418C21F|nr:hypothetical protein [Daejeonella oryzae]